MNAQKVTEHIISWLKTYAENAGVKGFVIGFLAESILRLTSTLCAATGFPTLCVEMPIHQAPNQVTRAEAHIAQLKDRYANVSSVRVDLTSSFDNFINVVPEVASSEQVALSLANTRARLRMTLCIILRDCTIIWLLEREIKLKILALDFIPSMAMVVLI